MRSCLPRSYDYAGEVFFLHSLLLAEIRADAFCAVQSLCVQVIRHYYAENISLARLCELHGWSLRENPRRVFDAVMFSNEIDLLEIRLQVLLQFCFNWFIGSFHIEWLHKLIAHELHCSHLLLLLSVCWAKGLCFLFVKKFPYLLKYRYSVWMVFWLKLCLTVIFGFVM